MDLLRSLLDVFYPPRCLLCRAFLGDHWVEIENRRILICPECLDRFRAIGSPLCPVCSRPFFQTADGDHLCEDCLRKRPLFEALFAPYSYEDPLMTAIYQFKYGKKAIVSDSLGPLLAQFSLKRFAHRSDLLVMPVPLHPKRLREREFNQSLLLARHVAAALGAELNFLSLRRIKHTAPQMGLGKDERRKNLRGAFKVAKPEEIKRRSVLLVDDVATTGNTLNECARALKRNGCKEVYCLVMARAVKMI